MSESLETMSELVASDGLGPEPKLESLWWAWSCSQDRSDVGHSVMRSGHCGHVSKMHTCAEASRDTQPSHRCVVWWCKLALVGRVPAQAEKTGDGDDENFCKLFFWVKGRKKLTERTHTKVPGGLCLVGHSSTFLFIAEVVSAKLWRVHRVYQRQRFSGRGNICGCTATGTLAWDTAVTRWADGEEWVSTRQRPARRTTRTISSRQLCKE